MLPPRYILTAYDPRTETWDTRPAPDVEYAALLAEDLAETFGWADVWRVYPDLVVHYDRVHAATPRTPQRRYLDRVTSSLSLATSRWYAAIATGDLGLADAAWYDYSRVIGGTPAARVAIRAMEAA